MESEEFDYDEVKFDSVQVLHDQGRITQIYFLLFDLWNINQENSAKYIYLNYNDQYENVCEKMLNVFIELEEYEKCSVVRDWLIEIEKIKVLDLK
jgi:hypothetical protein